MPPPRVRWTPGARGYFDKLHLHDTTHIDTAIFRMVQHREGQLAKVPGDPRGFFLLASPFVIRFEVNADGTEILILDTYRAR